MYRIIKNEGRLCIITFHSLEDRAVKMLMLMHKESAHVLKIYHIVYVVQNQKEK